MRGHRFGLREGEIDNQPPGRRDLLLQVVIFDGRNKRETYR